IVYRVSDHHPPHPELSPLPLHDALPICRDTHHKEGDDEHAFAADQVTEVSGDDTPERPGEKRHAKGRERQQKASDLSRVGEEDRSEEHTSELQSRENLVCRLLLEKKKTT